MNRVIKFINFKTFILSVYMKIGSYVSASCGYSLKFKRLILYMIVSSLQLKPFVVIPFRNQTNNIVCVLSFRTVDLTMPYGVNARSYARVSGAKD
jgi:hypothetical protein